MRLDDYFENVVLLIADELRSDCLEFFNSFVLLTMSDSATDSSLFNYASSCNNPLSSASKYANTDSTLRAPHQGSE